MSEWNRPRALALAILEDVERKGAWAEERIDAELSRRPDLDPRDAALVTELVYGTLRRQGTIDALLAPHSKVPLRKLERRVLLALRLAVYQLYWLDRIPASAAIDESVALLGKDKRRRGFANAVLRAADRERRDLAFEEIADWTGRMAARHSHPPALLAFWERELGREETEALAAANNLAPPVCVRANLLKTNRRELVALFERARVAARPGAYAPEAAVLEGAGDLRRSGFWRTGLCDVQDEASQLVALLLGARPHRRVLDLCAGAGGKACAVAERMEGTGRVVAVDVSERKLASLAERAARLGIANIETRALDAAEASPEALGAPYDCVLVDAPCSGLGTLRHNPERKWRFSPEEIGPLAELQARLLAAGARVLRPSGTLLYSTCTLSRAENEDVARAFVAARPDFRIDDPRPALPESARGLVDEDGFFRTAPHRQGTDGLFAARLTRGP